MWTIFTPGIIYFRDFRQKIETTSELHKMPIEIPPAYIGLLASLVQDRFVMII